MAQQARRRWASAGALALAAGGAYAQVPDIVGVADAGARALAMGGATQATDITPHAALQNPAGLGYIAGPTLTVGFRTEPDYELSLTGSLGSPSSQVQRNFGRYAFTHLGYAQPLGRGGLGITYSMGGYALSTSQAGYLSDGALTAANYRSSLKAQTDFFTVGYGEDKGGHAWGLALIYASQYLSSQEQYDLYSGYTKTGSVSTNASGNAGGIGAVAGFQAPAGDRSLFGLSVRTPVSLSGGNREVRDRMPRIPGRASASYAVRAGMKKGSPDSLVYAAQADWYYGGDSSADVERKDGLGFGLGLEYSLVRGGGRWPVRLGYQHVPDLGSGFSTRDAVTFGLGWRPEKGRLGVDLAFLSDFKGGPYDASLGITYRLGD